MAADGRKLGLALSGGGFRASFFHIGVLARLAELGVLRSVEVISTVSGGSIVGALWYLHVKALLEDPRHGGDPPPAAYVAAVQRLEQEFLAATERNIRGRVFLNPWKNLKMSLPSYSRSTRIGDLYDRHFYKRAWPEDEVEKRFFGLVEKPIEMHQLLIHPADVPRDTRFVPDEQNAVRDAKVPVLLLNATSLNTGHNWRFEAVGMGEPIAGDAEMRRVSLDLDKNPVYEQGYYQFADRGWSGNGSVLPEKLASYPLGKAVAASACVPGLFHPLEIKGSHGRGRRVELVDGGVHDNQGVQGLFDTGCTHMIVSDASGQMEELPQPGARIPSVVGRTTSVYGSRLRKEQLVRARDRGRSPAHPEQAVALMHLRSGLPRDLIPPHEGRRADPTPEEADPPSAAFGVSEDVQRHLAGIRTDLDTFGRCEAWTLSLDGYLMTDRFVDMAAFGASAPDGEREEHEGLWNFTHVSDWIGAPEPPRWYVRALAVGSKRFLKPLALQPLLWAVVLVAIAVGLGFWRPWDDWAAVRDGIADAATANIPLWGALAALGLGVLYVAEKAAALRLLSRPLITFALPILLAPLLWVFAVLSLVEGRLYRRLARVRTRSPV
ncbi:MAG: patatin-like phospholipase family protein [Thermoleophilaceae bacterium]